MVSHGASAGFGSNRSMARKAARKVSWTTSSAVSRLPVRRYASVTRRGAVLANQLGVRSLGAFLASSDKLTLIPDAVLHASSG